MTAPKRQKTEAEDGASDNSRPRRMLTEAQVFAIVPVSRVTLWRMVKAGPFPRPTYISANRHVWYEDELIAWQNKINGHPPWPPKQRPEILVSQRFGRE